MLADQRRYLLMARETIAQVADGRAQLSEDEASRVTRLMERYLPGAPLSWLVGAGAVGSRRRARAAGRGAMTPTTMRAVVLRAAGGPEQLVHEQVATPAPGRGEALVRVHAAALTRDELEWPVDRLPAIPSYELSGVVAALGPGVDGLAVGEAVFGMTAFDRDGVAADYAAIPTELLAPKPRALSHAEAAAVPLAALSAWQGLFDHGRLAARERVLIHGATGGVGQFATQLGEPPRRPRDRNHFGARRRASARARRRHRPRPHRGAMGRGPRARRPRLRHRRAASGWLAPPACCAKVAGSSRWPRSRLR